MFRLFTFLGCAMVLSQTKAADFPPIEKLPSIPGFPDVLTTMDGKNITTKEDWEKIRKPELKALFLHYMYGPFPPPPQNLKGIVIHEDLLVTKDKVRLMEVHLQFDVYGIKNPTPIWLLIAMPAEAKGPIPFFVGPNFNGNHVLTDDERIHIPNVWMYPKSPGIKNERATALGRGKMKDVWPLDLICKKGYGVATFYNGDLQPDRPAVKEGLRAIVPEGETPPPAIATWAYGVSRVIDYLHTLPVVDKSRIAVVGHSRLGKTAFLAGAFDERIAVVIPHQAGCGGSGPNRHTDPKAEGVKRITTSFPHWFAPRFTAFGDDTSKIPFDQHALVALCAPRPVLFTNAEEDLWANPSGQFKMLQEAEPVYKLYGVEGLEGNTKAEPNKLINTRLGYFIRPGKHAMTTPDWEVYLEYVSKWMPKK